MAAMPNPTRKPPARKLLRLKVRRLASHRANQEADTAIKRDRPVNGTSYDMGTGVRNESMPTKCIDQIPHPMAAAPPANQKGPDRCPWDAATRDVKSSAT